MACRMVMCENELDATTTEAAANGTNSQEPNDTDETCGHGDVILDENASSDPSSSAVTDTSSDKELSDCQAQRIVSTTDQLALNAPMKTANVEFDTTTLTSAGNEKTSPDSDSFDNAMCTLADTESERNADKPVERDKQLKVSDVLENAIKIGEDIEDINSKYGESASGDIMPKLIFVLSKLESLVATHNENESKIKALLLEQEDLHGEKEKSERAKRKLAKRLAETENDVKYGERQLQIQIRILTAENKSLTKDLRKKRKKVARKRKSGHGSFLWLLDRILFGGRIFFVTKELPRDVKAVRECNTIISSQREEIERLTRAIDIQEQENARRMGMNSEIRIRNKYLEIEVSDMEKRLSYVEPDEHDDGIDSFPTLKEKNYKKVPMDDGLGKKSLSDEINSKCEQAKLSECFDPHIDYRILITDSTEDSGYWDTLSNHADTDGPDETIFEPPACRHNDDEVTASSSEITIENIEADSNVCELGGRGVSRTQTNLIDCDNYSNSSVDINEECYNNSSHEDMFYAENAKYEVKVDIHSNRKDFKKLQLAQELRDSMTTIKDPNCLEPNYDELYEHNNSDAKSDSTDGNTCYHWDEVDSKTSYEDVRCSLTSSDEKLHLYFILDKKNMSAKKVEKNEYQHFLKSRSLPKINTAFDANDVNLDKLHATYDNITSLSGVGHIREDSPISF